MPKLTIPVYDYSTKAGIPNLAVYLWEGGGGLEPAETATHSGKTNSAGNAIFDVSEGFFGVCISDGGYEAADPNQAVPDEWKAVYSACGACGVTRDTTYPFPLIPACPMWMNTIHTLAVKYGLKRIQEEIETLAENKGCNLT